MGICSIMMTSPDAPHPASMFSPDMSIFISLSCEHSWASNGFSPWGVRSDDMRPAADSGVSGPYMHIPGRWDMRHASRTKRISAMVARISQGVLVVAGWLLTVFRTPLTMVSTTGSWA